LTPSPSPTPLLDGLSILLLEDEVLIAMDVEQLCRDHGAGRVTTVRDVAGLDRHKAGTGFDAAIVDLVLGGASTLDFARHLQSGKIPFVFASGYSELGELEREFPGVALVSKPYSGTDLIEALARACGRLPAQLLGDAIT